MYSLSTEDCKPLSEFSHHWVNSSLGFIAWNSLWTVSCDKKSCVNNHIEKVIVGKEDIYLDIDMYLNWLIDLHFSSGLPPVSSIWIPRLFLTFSAHFSLTSQHISDGYRMKSWAKRGKILHLQPLGFYKNMPSNQGQTLGHLSQIIFPDSQQKILKFPDFPEGQKFPWFSLMGATRSHGPYKSIWEWMFVLYLPHPSWIWHSLLWVVLELEQLRLDLKLEIPDSH